MNPLVAAAPSGTATAGGTASCVPRPASTGASSVTSTGAGAATSTGATATQTGGDDDKSRGGRPTGFPTGNYPSEWSGYPTARPTGQEKRQDINYCDDDSNSNSNSGVTIIGSSQSNTNKMLVAHGAIAALAFVILFPFGAIAVRLASFTGLVWVHAAVQGFAYLLYVVAFGLGIYIANQKQLVSVVNLSGKYSLTTS